MSRWVNYSKLSEINLSFPYLPRFFQGPLQSHSTVLLLQPASRRRENIGVPKAVCIRWTITSHISFRTTQDSLNTFFSAPALMCMFCSLNTRDKRRSWQIGRLWCNAGSSALLGRSGPGRLQVAMFDLKHTLQCSLASILYNDLHIILMHTTKLRLQGCKVG
jgi:hypothetical protein